MSGVRIPAFIFKRPYWSAYTRKAAEAAVEEIVRVNGVSRLAAVRFLQDYLDRLESELLAAGEE
jgi:hypothetical protein